MTTDTAARKIPDYDHSAWDRAGRALFDAMWFQLVAIIAVALCVLVGAVPSVWLLRAWVALAVEAGGMLLLAYRGRIADRLSGGGD